MKKIEFDQNFTQWIKRKQYSPKQAIATCKLMKFQQSTPG